LLPVWLRTACAEEKQTVRVAVVGGLIRSGLWPALARAFEAESGSHAEVAVSGNREILAEAFRAGKADLIAIHQSPTATNLVSDAYATNMQVWTRNEFVIVGPKNDPAHIRGLHDGAVALKRIAESQAPFADYRNSGPRDISDALWKKAGI